MAKKAKKEGSGALTDDIFGALGAAEAQDEGQDEGKGGPDPKLSKLEARIEALQGELSRVSRTNSALMAGPGQYAPGPGHQEPSGPVEVNMEGLPDPTLDQEGYHKELSRRIAATVEANMQRQLEAQEATRAQNDDLNRRTNMLWEEFSEAYPDLAKHRDLVEVTATAVSQRAAAKGLDVQRYMFGASEQYLADVAAEMKKRFGKAIEVMGKDEGTDDTGADEGESGDEHVPAHIKEATRALGIQGGVPSSGTKVSEKGKGESADLVSDLHKLQRSLNLY